MSEITYAPPPPPPPSVPAQPQGFDFAKPFSYVFDDPDWLTKILIGGLFYLAGFLLIGWFFILGYVAQTTRNVVANHPRPLPEWTNLGDFFSEGVRLFGIGLCIFLPLMLLFFGIMIPAGMIGSIDNEAADAIGGIMSGAIVCLLMPISLIVTFFLPGMLLFASVERRFGAAFEFGRIWPFIKQNIGNYLLAIVVYLIARFIGSFGLILLCIGVVFTGFWALLITAHAFAQVYRLATAPQTAS